MLATVCGAMASRFLVPFPPASINLKIWQPFDHAGTKSGLRAQPGQHRLVAPNRPTAKLSFSLRQAAGSRIFVSLLNER